MSASRVAYTVFVAFVSVLATLVVVSLVSREDSPPAKTGQRSSQEPPRFTMEEVREHGDSESCWKVIEGVVYDLTDYIPRHPVDEETFVRWCGREATAAWHDTRGGRGHSERAQSMLRKYRIGELADAEQSGNTPEPDSDPARQRAPGASGALAQRQGQVLLSLSPGEYLDGVYRGNFIDRGQIQVSLQFRIEDGTLYDLSYRHLQYRDVDYLALDEQNGLYAVMRQHLQIVSELEGQPLSDIFRLYEPGRVVDDIDGYSGASLRGAKIMHAIRDGLNRGVYRW